MKLLTLFPVMHVGVLTAEIAAPWVVSLKVPKRGRVMVDDQRLISIKVRKVKCIVPYKSAYSTYIYPFQNTQYTVGDPAFEFIVRPYENKKVTFESRKFVKSFLSVDQNAAVSVREMPPDSSEVQFVVRVQVHMYIHSYIIMYTIFRVIPSHIYALGACACNNVVSVTIVSPLLN